MATQASGPGGGPGFRLAGFPKEFEKNFLETFDKRYYGIFFLTFFMFYGFAFYMSVQDWSLSDEQIQALKAHVIEHVYDVKLELDQIEEVQEDQLQGGAGDEAEEEPEEVSEKTKERIEEDRVQRSRRRDNSRAARERQSQQMQEEVGGTGILALATSASGGGAGDLSYVDALGDGSSGIADIGDVIEGTGGIQTASTPNARTTKGGPDRSDGSATGIDDMIGGTSVGGTANFDRRGEINLASENVQLTSGAGSRDPDALTASINKQSGLIESCYKRSARVNPNLRGRIELQIGIAATGRVTTAKIVSSTLGDKRLEDCILRSIKRWKFSQVDSGDVVIQIPFIF